MAAGGRVVPIEVKAGKTGTLKSLHSFVNAKKSRLAVRFNSEPASMLAATTPAVRGKEWNGEQPYRLLSLPLYCAGVCRELVADISRKSSLDP